MAEQGSSQTVEGEKKTRLALSDCQAGLWPTSIQTRLHDAAAGRLSLPGEPLAGVWPGLQAAVAQRLHLPRARPAQRVEPPGSAGCPGTLPCTPARLWSRAARPSLTLHRGHGVCKKREAKFPHFKT